MSKTNTNFIDITGQKFNRWTVIKRTPNDKDNKACWLCKCECGKESIVRASNLRNGRSMSCGCHKAELTHKRQFIDLTGHKTGKLTVQSVAFRKKRADNYYSRQTFWNCICECGNTTVVSMSNLKDGRTSSCGCARIESALKTAKKRLSPDPLLRSIWAVYKHIYADGDLTLEEFKILTKKPCYYCGTPYNNSNCYNVYRRKAQKKKFGTTLDDLSKADFYYNGLDRLDNSKPHNRDNVVPCCKYCNRAKLGMNVQEFTTWIKRCSANYLHGLSPEDVNTAIQMFKKQKEEDSSCLESSSELALVS